MLVHGINGVVVLKHMCHTYKSRLLMQTRKLDPEVTEAAVAVCENVLRLRQRNHADIVDRPLSKIERKEFAHADRAGALRIESDVCSTLAVVF